MTKKSNKRFVYYQFAVLALFLSVTVLNEVVDIPHYLLGDTPNPPLRRKGEIAIEVLVATLAFAAELAFVGKLRSDIAILEGFIPICASCKKIRTMKHWESAEDYIHSHPLADLTRSLCPECCAHSAQRFQRRGARDAGDVAAVS